MCWTKVTSMHKISTKKLLIELYLLHLRKAYFCEVPLPLILAELILSAKFTSDFDRRVDLISTREQIIPTTILDTCPLDFHTFLRL